MKMIVAKILACIAHHEQAHELLKQELTKIDQRDPRNDSRINEIKRQKLHHKDLIEAGKRQIREIEAAMAVTAPEAEVISFEQFRHVQGTAVGDVEEVPRRALAG